MIGREHDAGSLAGIRHGSDTPATMPGMANFRHAA